jgi:Ser/Thr protein kinase RdoA (MazF antagonist)
MSGSAAATLADARAACRAGWFEPVLLSVIGGGRINDTVLVRDARQRAFVLQRVSEQVFPEPARLMRQLARISEHLQQQAPGWMPELVRARASAPSIDHAGGHWRLWRYVAGEHLRSAGTEALVAKRLAAAGFAFGRTQVLLENLPGERLQPAIAHYHDLTWFLARFDEVASAASDEWRRRVGEVRAMAETFGEADGYIHGDCKPDNLQFVTGTATVAAVLDLDTAMWANRALDFGDLIRSSVWHNERYEHGYFVQLATGFVRAQQASAAPSALADLVAAPRYVSAMLSLRYLLDHLTGDRVFKTTARGDNLRRAERQHRRTLQLEAAARQMNSTLRALNDGARGAGFQAGS